jgi:hypothetical protein
VIDRISITIRPSVSDTEMLTVEDAMQQVLDFFRLLEHADSTEGGQREIEWRLANVSMNSPFTAEGIAIGVRPDFAVAARVMALKSRVNDGLRQIVEEHSLPEWFDDDAEDLTRRLMSRNINGIGRTDLRFFDEKMPFVINQKAAESILDVIQACKSEENSSYNLTHTSYGSIDSIITSAQTYYSKPAILVRDRIRRYEIPCVLYGEEAKRFSQEKSLALLLHRADRGRRMGV